MLGYQYNAVTDPSCLRDCFSEDPQDPTNCIHSLLSDVLSRGVCRQDPLLDYSLSEQCSVADGDILKGTCSQQTELYLKTESCFRAAYEQETFVRNSIFMMIYNSCTSNITQYLMKRVGQIPSFYPERKKSRINPVTNIGVGFKTRIKYENTRNRYPWMCSLRTHGINPEHLCTVNLLSIPPKPTVLIGAAHCTLICKERGKKMPSCCCVLEGVESCRSDEAKCGQDAIASQILPDEVDIVCGEWELGPVPRTVSKESYNLVLQVTDIILHEKYDNNGGPSNGNDIAVFKVIEDQMKFAESKKIYPACLPTSNRKKPSAGIISGWAPPPPFYFVQSFFSALVQHFEDMYKQFHYKMVIQESCEDPKRIQIYGRELAYPSNTSYPAGTVCAKELTRHCFSGGDSGSPNGH